MKPKNSAITNIINDINRIYPSDCPAVNPNCTPGYSSMNDTTNSHSNIQRNIQQNSKHLIVENQLVLQSLDQSDFQNNIQNIQQSFDESDFFQINNDISSGRDKIDSIINIKRDKVNNKNKSTESNVLFVKKKSKVIDSPIIVQSFDIENEADMGEDEDKFILDSSILSQNNFTNNSTKIVTNLNIENIQNIDFKNLNPIFSESGPQFISKNKKSSNITFDSVFIPDIIKEQKFLRMPTRFQIPIQSTIESPEKFSHGPMPIPTSDSVVIDSEMFHGNRLKLKIITFNMNGKSFSSAKQKLSFMKPNSFHIYVFASQECERSIEKSFFNEKKKKWMGLLSEIFAKEYEFVASINQMAMHLIVMVKKPLEKYISNIYTQKICCGWKNRVGNKGAVAISFSFGGSRLMFINCHLAAHQNNIQQRIADYEFIIKSLKYPIKKNYQPSNREKNIVQRNNNEYIHDFELDREQFNVFNDFDYIIFSGDTNFRVDATRSKVDEWIRDFPRSRMEILAHDQLIKIRKEGLAFTQFLEGEINFLPTYKFDKQSNTYDTSEKKRIPSYTDRILYYFNKSFDNEIFLQDYTVGDCLLSDHKPVISKFLVKVDLAT